MIPVPADSRANRISLSNFHTADARVVDVSRGPSEKTCASIQIAVNHLA